MTSPTLEIQNLTRSCNEALILAVLSTGPHHGYQLALALEEKSGGEFRFPHGTLYPILHRLESDGLISGVWQETVSKRRRKSYVLTPAGRRSAGEHAAAWRRFCDRFFAILKEVET